MKFDHRYLFQEQILNYMKHFIQFIFTLSPLLMSAQFSEERLIADHFSVVDFEVIDVDNDGDYDIVTSKANDYGPFHWFENLDGLGNFGLPKIIEVGIGPTTVAYPISSADVDSNGIQEIFVSPHCFFEPDGQGGFQKTIDSPDSIFQILNWPIWTGMVIWTYSSLIHILSTTMIFRLDGA